jgi:hypothetical protein
MRKSRKLFGSCWSIVYISSNNLNSARVGLETVVVVVMAVEVTAAMLENNLSGKSDAAALNAAAKLILLTKRG